MNVIKYSLEISFTNDVLGAQPANPDILNDWVHEKARKANPDIDAAELEAELEALPTGELREKLEEQKSTCFFRTPEGHLCVARHVPIGFLKEAGNVLKDGVGVKALRSKLSATVFCQPKFIPLLREGEPLAAPDGLLTRPLRAMTAQGPRVSLAASEVVHPPAGLVCEIHVLPTTPQGHAIVTEPILRELLDYGQYHGLGQWANGGYGTFEYELLAL